MTKQIQFLSNPINLRLLKQHLRVFSTDEDELIEMYANNAVAYIEDWICGYVRDAKETITTDFVNVNESIFLENYDSLVSIKSNNTDISVNDFDIKDGYITFFKEYSNVVIVYNCAKIDIKYLPQCINLIVGDWYENREGSALDNKSVSVAVSTALSRMLFMHSQPVK